jgi:hypothetical protein
LSIARTALKMAFPFEDETPVWIQFGSPPEAGGIGRLRDPVLDALVFTMPASHTHNARLDHRQDIKT